MNPALEYAEQTLGVHSCYEAAQAARSDLDEIVTGLDKAQDTRRTLVEEIADREADLLIEERGKHADSSANWMEQHMKTVKRKDEQLSDLRRRLNDAQATIAGLEYDADMVKFQIKIQCARMEELGGYLNYLAAIKQAETLRIQTEQK